MLVKSIFRSTAVLFLFSAVAIGFTTAPVRAEDVPKPLGTFRDWTTFSLTQNGTRVCYAVSEAKEKLPKNVKHGDVYFMVSNWVSGNKGEPSLVTGYSFKPGSTVTAEIGSSKWTLFTKDNGAWLSESKDEKTLINAMKRGSTMRVKGTSARGTATEYRISLSGVTKAINTINTSCK